MTELSPTFRERAWIVWNTVEDTAATTPWGAIAIFNTRGVAEALLARTSPELRANLVVRPIRIQADDD